MWPDAASVVYYVGIGVHALIAALLGQRLGLRARVPVAISVCYLAGMTIGAKTLSDIGEGRFEPGALLRREHFVAGGYWGGPAVYLVLGVGVVWGMMRRRAGSAELEVLSAEGMGGRGTRRRGDAGRDSRRGGCEKGFSRQRRFPQGWVREGIYARADCGLDDRGNQ